MGRYRKSNEDGKSLYRVLANHHDHPLAYRGGQVLEHRKVLFDSIGPGAHPCRWCGDLVTWQVKAYNRRGNLIVDHVDGNRYNNDLSNLVPACGSCNTRRAMEKIVKDDEVFVTRADGRRARATRRTCQHCGVDFLVETRTLKIENRGLFCSRICRNRGMTKARTS